MTCTRTIAACDKAARAEIVQGAFAGRIPPAPPTLRQLAERAIAAAIERLAPEADYNAAIADAYDRAEAFRSRFNEVTGLDARLIRALLNEGILG